MGNTAAVQWEGIRIYAHLPREWIPGSDWKWPIAKTLFNEQLIPGLESTKLFVSRNLTALKSTVLKVVKWNHHKL
jgi:hypothetical protein